MTKVTIDEFPVNRREGLGPKPPAMGSKKARSRKSLVNQHEQELADKLGGFRNPQSGALSPFKGDVSLDDFLFDSKETENSSIIVSHVDLTKISQEARQSGKIAGLILTIKKIPYTIPNEWVMLSIEDFGDLLDELKELKNECRSLKSARKSEETNSDGEERGEITTE